MSGVPGAGLAKGLAVTLRTMVRHAHTAQYPDVRPALPPRSRGVIALFEENCTVCMLCARECPDWCIYIDSHKEVVPPARPGGRERSRNVLDRFAIDFSLCMYCGICVEVCPFDALFWSPEFEYAETDLLELTHEKDRLREWMWTVPAPPALDPAAEEPKELASARRAAAPPGSAPPGKGDRPERPARADRPERPARAERPERPARAERPERPARKPAAETPEQAAPPAGADSGERPKPEGGDDQ